MKLDLNLPEKILRMFFKSINPYTQEIVSTYHILTTRQLLQKFNLADNAFHHWKLTTSYERAQ